MKLSRPGAAYAALATLTLAVFSLPAEAVAGACSVTTKLAKTGCDQRASANFSFDAGVCANFFSPFEKERCLKIATDARTAAKQLCTEQVTARDNVCGAIGQAPYDPEIEPADFTTNITNPFFPFKPGNQWIYRSGDAEVTVTVLTKTIKLDGVTCIVVRDVNRVDGKIEEDTLDYYAQHRDGSVWYFGEDTISYNNGVASTKGSWRTGFDGARPGITMTANPPPLGKTYRQEFRLGVAEDMARNIAVNQHVTVPFGTFNNALQVHEFTPIEPKKSEDKYYVPGVGLVLAVDLVSGDREELVSFKPGS